MTIDSNQPAIEFRKRRLIHARLVIEAVQKRVAGKFQEIAPAVKVLRKQHKMKSTISNARMGSVAAISWCNVRLNTKNRLDALLARLKIKLQRSKQIAVISDRHGIHTKRLDASDQLLDAITAVKQRVLTVQMQVCKLWRTVIDGCGSSGFHAGVGGYVCHRLPV